MDTIPVSTGNEEAGIRTADARIGFLPGGGGRADSLSLN